MATVELVVKTIDQSSTTLGKVDAKYKEFSDRMTKLTQYQMVAEQQKAKAVEEANKRQQASYAALAKGASIAFGTFTALGAGVIKSLQASFDATMKFGGEVRDLAIITGTGAEATSRFLQVLDDFQIGAEEVTAALRFMKGQGLSPTIETLAKLSDQFLAIEDPVKRTEFIMKNLGRGGAQWVNVLSQGGDNLLELNSAVDKNLTLTDADIKATEEWRLELDAFNDEVEATKMSIGKGLMPMATDLLATIRDLSDNGIGYGADKLNGWNMFMEFGEKRVAAMHIRMAEANGDYKDFGTRLRESNEALIGNSLAMGMTEEALKELTKANERELNVLDSLSTELSDYHTRQGELIATHDDLIAKKEDLIARGWSAESKKVKEVDEALAANAAAQAENAAATEDATNRRILARAQELLSVDGLTTAEKNGLIERGLQMGIYTEEAAAQMLKEENAASGLAKSISGLGDNIEHSGARARDAIGYFGDLGVAARGLAEGVHEANGPVAQLKRDLAGLPPSGTAWAYSFDISVSGRVPNLNVLNAINEGQRVQAPIAPKPGQSTYNQNMASGGTLGSGWSIVGDAPGGVFTPYTEAILNGVVFDAKMTRMLKAAGLLDNATSHAVVEGYSPGEGGVGTSTRTTRRRAETPKGTIPGTFGEGAYPAGTSDAAILAANVANEAVSTSQAAVMQGQQTQTQMANQTVAITQTQQQTSNTLAALLQETNRLLRKQPTRDDAYNSAKYSSQTNI